MLIFTYECCTILTVTFTLLAIAIKLIADKINKKRTKYINKENSKIPIGFYLCVTNIITLLITNFIVFYRW